MKSLKKRELSPKQNHLLRPKCPQHRSFSYEQKCKSVGALGRRKNTYLKSSRKNNPLAEETWLSFLDNPPTKQGMYLCIVRDTKTHEAKERFIKLTKDTSGKMGAAIDGTLLSWRPHYTREELAIFKRDFEEEEDVPQTFSPVMT